MVQVKICKIVIVQKSENLLLHQFLFGSRHNPKNQTRSSFRRLTPRSKNYEVHSLPLKLLYDHKVNQAPNFYTVKVLTPKFIYTLPLVALFYTIFERFTNYFAIRKIQFSEKFHNGNPQNQSKSDHCGTILSFQYWSKILVLAPNSKTVVTIKVIPAFLLMYGTLL